MSPYSMMGRRQTLTFIALIKDYIKIVELLLQQDTTPPLLQLTVKEIHDLAVSFRCCNIHKGDRARVRSSLNIARQCRLSMLSLYTNVNNFGFYVFSQLMSKK